MRLTSRPGPCGRAAVPLALAALAMLAGQAAPPANPQAPPDDDEPQGERIAPATPTPAVVQVRRALGSSLLREGSRLVRAGGRAERDEIRRTWSFVVDSGDPRVPRHEFTLLPSSLLEEMERMIVQAGDRRLVFEVTGEIYVHHGRNYLMLSQPALLVAHESTDEGADTPGATDPPEGDVTGDSAADIIRDLERSAGGIPRRWANPAEPELDIGFDTGDPSPQPVVFEGTTLLARRGRIRRTSRGSFVLVLDADAEGLADPPMTLLPCLLLERLEKHAEEAGDRAPVLMSGQVVTYRGRYYLLPTIYRIPTERTNLTP